MSDQPKYTIRLINAAEREHIIRANVAASNTTQPFYEFRNEKKLLPVIRIPIGLPIYRTENFRTFTLQKQYIIKAAGEEIRRVRPVRLVRQNA